MSKFAAKGVPFITLLCLTVVMPVAAQGADTPSGFPVRWGILPYPGCLEPCISIACKADGGLALKADGTVCERTDLTNVRAIAAGDYHCLALLHDGTVRAWGRIYDSGKYINDTVPEGLSNVVAISAGTRHSLVLKSDGTLFAWGDNSYGQTNVAGMKDIVAIAAGGYHNLALDKNGKLNAWGYNRWHQSDPVSMTDIAAMAAGDCHNLVVKSNGTVVAWGWNADHQASVPAGLTNVIAVAGGWNHSLALKADGTVVAWGNNHSGESTVPPGLCNVIAIAANGHNSAALVRGLEFQQPLLSQTAYQGETVHFDMPAKGYPPAFYSCIDAGRQLVSCGTDSCLGITNVQFARIGSYTIVASNMFGSITSAPVSLNVVTGVQRRLVRGINVNVSPGSPITVEHSEFLGRSEPWSWMETFAPTSSWHYVFDLSTPLPSTRYYRAWQEGAPVGPSLMPPRMVPAVTVTGTPPQSVRIDCINRYGPTNNWITLDTVALSQASQYFFDVSAPGMPDRLYRLVQAP